MDDERLLAEALRAHAAGGVSSPGGTSTPPSAEQTAEDTGADSGGSRLRDRFRPLTRNRKAEEADLDAASDVTQTTARPDPSVVPPAPPRPTGPTPAPGFPATGRPGPPPARPAPRPTAVTGERPWPRTGPPQPARPGPPVPSGPVARPGMANVPHPRPAPAGPTGAIPAARPVGTDRDVPAPWTPARIAWWSGMALLAGAVAGALAAVGTLGLPG
ncbi:hypothetical protein Acsp06_22020 [Actinomycetospora sp. NBRC 106375]|uniref:hypothetical protein n=1 Tax=Actinomycetospora sp. NBRC 106375 TaxID=3032207 RepID=UPI0024A15B61|nr:hypothetical protein [Actinomycetospora sp. NBRC 106375]GLZ46017.1 hypothetical protein Acsp06_22020 [Actinomycetospora sp. NBRC 106375]